MKPARLMDLFSGAGGMSLGFTRLSRGKFQSVWALDNNEDAIAVYNRNFGEHGRVGDVEDILRYERGAIPRADVVIGGPPCQGFSLLNKNKAGDPRRSLWSCFLEITELSGARIFVMENVRHLLGTPEHSEIIQCASELGFRTTSVCLCAADYGVPQVRHRAFILGCRFDYPAGIFPPPRTHFDPKIDVGAGLAEGYISKPRPWTTVRQAIRDLASPRGTILGEFPPPYDIHVGRTPTPLSKARYRAIPREGMNRFDLQKRAPELTPACWINKKSGGTDLFGRLWWDRPSVTIRTEFYKPEKGRYLHPREHRPITHREAARLQSFPDDFIFQGSKTEIAKQIGNAVPPLLAARVADAVWEIRRCAPDA